MQCFYLLNASLKSRTFVADFFSAAQQFKYFSCMTISEINIYPIKSAKGIALQTALVERRGFQFDRRWMVVDDAGVFMSQREFPRLALISVELNSDRLSVNAPGMGTLSILFQQRNGDSIRVQVWDDIVQAVSVGEAARKWFGEFLGVACQAVFMPEDSVRPVNPKYAVNKDIVSFADAFPLLLISESSLGDLNARLTKPVPMNRFRPSIVVRECEAFAEDRWKRIRLGEVVLHIVKPCSRCVTTTVDQATGIRGKEPLATLSQYRKIGDKVFFGQNAIPAMTGLLRIGDRVEVIE